MSSVSAPRLRLTTPSGEPSVLSAPKLVSSVPSVLKRWTTRLRVAPPVLVEWPATTILPSACTAIAWAWSLPLPSDRLTTPSGVPSFARPKLASSVPGNTGSSDPPPQPAASSATSAPVTRAHAGRDAVRRWGEPQELKVFRMNRPLEWKECDRCGKRIPLGRLLGKSAW